MHLSGSRHTHWPLRGGCAKGQVLLCAHTVTASPWINLRNLSLRESHHGHTYVKLWYWQAYRKPNCQFTCEKYLAHFISIDYSYLLTTWTGPGRLQWIVGISIYLLQYIQLSGIFRWHLLIRIHVFILCIYVECIYGFFSFYRVEFLHLFHFFHCSLGMATREINATSCFGTTKKFIFIHCQLFFFVLFLLPWHSLH